MRGLVLLSVAWTAVAGSARAEASFDDDCWGRRQRMIDAAEHEPQVSERIAILDALPACDDASPSDASTQPRERHGFVIEIAGGAGTSVASTGSMTSTGSTNLALSAGLGGFLTPSVALMVRSAGVAVWNNYGSGYAGFLGPTLQVWATDQLFAGGGVGLGVTTCGSCRTSVGFDGRVGYAFARDGRGVNMFVEATHHTLDFETYGGGGGSSVGITTFLLQLGYAGF